MNQQAGKYLIFFGVAIIAIGVIIYFFPNAFKWFGRLPGDIRIEKENVKIYFPITTIIVLSLLFTLLINLLKKW